MRVELACGSQLWVDEFRNLGAEHGWYSKEIIESRLEWHRLGPARFHHNMGCSKL